MIIEDKRDTNVEIWRPLHDEAISPPEYARNPDPLAAHIASRLTRIRNRGTNAVLRHDLIEHLWNQFGDQVVI